MKSLCDFASFRLHPSKSSGAWTRTRDLWVMLTTSAFAAPEFQDLWSGLSLHPRLRMTFFIMRYVRVPAVKSLHLSQLRLLRLARNDIEIWLGITFAASPNLTGDHT